MSATFRNGVWCEDLHYYNMVTTADNCAKEVPLDYHGCAISIV